MSEPNEDQGDQGNVAPAGQGVSDDEMAEIVADETDSASTNADEAGKDWNGDASEAPEPR